MHWARQWESHREPAWEPLGAGSSSSRWGSIKPLRDTHTLAMVTFSSWPWREKQRGANREKLLWVSPEEAAKKLLCCESFRLALSDALMLLLQVSELTYFTRHWASRHPFV